MKNDIITQLYTTENVSFRTLIETNRHCMFHDKPCDIKRRPSTFFNAGRKEKNLSGMYELKGPGIYDIIMCETR